jgi:capsular polysaccharide transport system permease protein
MITCTESTVKGKFLKHRKSLYVFFAVIGALFYRELGTRISEGRTGLFWTFFEPFFQIMVFVAIKVALFGRASATFDYAVFLSLNFLAFNLFKNIITKSSAVFRQNKGLFVYKQVKPIDTVLARSLVEMFISSILLLIFIFIGYYFDYDMNIKDFNGVVGGFVALILFALGLALLNATINAFFQNFGKLVSFMMMPLMFGSAVIFTVDATPDKLKAFVLINPVTHFMETIHGHYFYALDDRYVDYPTILIWTLAALFVGLWFYRHQEERIISAL